MPYSSEDTCGYDKGQVVIEEKLNSVDLTDKGIDLITGNSEDPTLFVLPDSM